MPGDHLGNHIATQNVRLSGNFLSGDGGNEGVYITANGRVGIGLDTADQRLHVDGSAQLKNGGLIFSNNYTEQNLSIRKSIPFEVSFNSTFCENDAVEKSRKKKNPREMLLKRMENLGYWA